MRSERRIRLARPREVPDLLELERAAGHRFADAGLPPDLAGLDPARLADAIAEGRVWVACVPADSSPLGFAMVERYPSTLHLCELDVAPAHMGRGHGRALVEQVCANALADGLSAVTLTTFAEVPWNAPTYRRWGFVELPLERQPAWLRAIREREDAGILRRWPRVAMRRPLG